MPVVAIPELNEYVTPEKAKRTGRLFLILFLAMSCCCGGMVFSVVAPVGEILSMGVNDFHRQCDIALGVTPGAAAPTPITTAAAPTARPSPSPRPTVNPYAALTIAAGDTDYTDRDRSCLAAMRVAPYQGQPLLEPNTGRTVACAGALALRYPESGGTAETAMYLRDVIYGASAATGGTCAVARAPRAVASADCGDPGRTEVVVLPETVGEQAWCGQVVDPGAVSAGDLVFWNYGENGAGRAGIALNTGEMVTVDSGGFVRTAIPAGEGVRIKRVLGVAL